jgi:hypothetical protein
MSGKPSLRLVEGVLGHSFLDTLPARLIGDKAYDGDPLDRALADRDGMEMIAPHRGQRREPTQDGRPLRRYRRRWRVERMCQTKRTVDRCGGVTTFAGALRPRL